MDKEKNKMSGGEKLAYFTFMTATGFLGIGASLVMKVNNIIIAGDETILIPSAILFLVGLVASMICAIDA